jgi:hypothetical protein
MLTGNVGLYIDVTVVLSFQGLVGGDTVLLGVNEECPPTEFRDKYPKVGTTRA